jgi:hypothetical protein
LHKDIDNGSDSYIGRWKPFVYENLAMGSGHVKSLLALEITPSHSPAIDAQATNPLACAPMALTGRIDYQRIPKWLIP